MSPGRLTRLRKERMQRDLRKIKYVTQRDAQSAIVHMIQKYGVSAVLMLEYRCWCNEKERHWHIGHMDKRSRVFTRNRMSEALLKERELYS
jgi:hypothetical protein